MNKFVRIENPQVGDFVVIDIKGAASTTEEVGTRLPIVAVSDYEVEAKPTDKDDPFNWCFVKMAGEHFHFERLIKSLTITVERLTLPTNSKERKNFPVHTGCLRYFPAALAGVSKTSKLGNDKHNPGEELHHARGKSMDHTDCIVRHLIDTDDLLAALNRGEKVNTEEILNEVNSMVWRALAYSQEIHEKFGAPLAPGARK